MPDRLTPEGFNNPEDNKVESKKPLFGMSEEEFQALKTFWRDDSMRSWLYKEKPQKADSGEQIYFQQMWDRERVYKQGLPISETIQTSGDDRESLQGDIRYKDQENIAQTFNPDKQLPPERKKQIAEMTLPVFKTKHLLFHTVRGQRNVPIIAKIGLVSRELGRRFTSKKYKGFAVHTSGWGTSPQGLNYIDVWNPAINKDNLSITHRSNDEVDPEYKAAAAGSSFVIKLKNPDKLLKKSFVAEGHSVVKSSIKPDELIGLVLDKNDLAFYGLLLEVNAPTPELRDKYQLLTAEEILEILGNNIEMPIYDKQGNQLWPQRVAADELLRTALEKQSQVKKD